MLFAQTHTLGRRNFSILICKFKNLSTPNLFCLSHFTLLNYLNRHLGTSICTSLMHDQESFKNLNFDLRTLQVVQIYFNSVDLLCDSNYRIQVGRIMLRILWKAPSLSLNMHIQPYPCVQIFRLFCVTPPFISQHNTHVGSTYHGNS